jgi:hypothetical protein
MSRRTSSAIETERDDAAHGGGRIVPLMRRLIELDERELDAARAELGTRSVEETVRAALREVALIGARLRQLEHERQAGSN